MTDLRENLGWIAGSVATAIGVAISWLVSSEIFATLVAVLVGFLASYFLQTITQKRAWKREYGVQIAEEVYGSLFSAIKGVILPLEEKWYSPLRFHAWRGMQYNHRHLMVPKKFRKRLDGLLESIEKYNDALNKLKSEIVPRIMNEESKRIFKVNVQGARIHLEIKIKEKSGSINSHTYDVLDCLVSQNHPKDAVLKAHPKAEIFESKMLFGQTPASSANVGKFDKFWESCVKRMDSDQDYQSLLRKSDRLLEEAKSIEEELAKRIEEPWNI